MPKGKLICAKNGAYIKWYKSDGHNITYIPKRNRELAERLAYKRFAKRGLGELRLERQELQQALKASAE